MCEIIAGYRTVWCLPWQHWIQFFCMTLNRQLHLALLAVFIMQLSLTSLGMYSYVIHRKPKLTIQVEFYVNTVILSLQGPVMEACLWCHLLMATVPLYTSRKESLASLTTCQSNKFWKEAVPHYHRTLMLQVQRSLLSPSQPCQNVPAACNLAAFSQLLAAYSTLDFTMSPLAGKGTWCLLPTTPAMLPTATKHFDRAASWPSSLDSGSNTKSPPPPPHSLHRTHSFIKN